MRLLAALALLALAAPLAAQDATPTSPTVIGDGEARVDVAHVRVTARIVVVDRDALTRAGLAYVVLGNDRVHVSSAARGGSRGVRIGVGTHGVTAFLDAVRSNRLIRSESTQQVLTMSGGQGIISSTELAVRHGAARTRGPSLAVSPTVRADGGIHLWVSTGHEDTVTHPWGYTVDGSPAAVETELIARDGEEVILASSSGVQTTRESGLLHWASGEHGRDVLVALTARVVHP